MDLNQVYSEFINHITDKDKCGLAGPVEISKIEDSFARLFIAYFNCRYRPAASQPGIKADAESRCPLYEDYKKSCTAWQNRQKELNRTA